MKKIEKFLLQGTAFTVGVLLVFFLLAKAFDVDAYLKLANFFVCILIGYAINAANLIFKIKKLQIWFKVPIHYAALMAFYIPFLYISIPDFMQRPAAVFVAIMIYTILYALLTVAVWGIKKIVKTLDNKLETNK